MNLSERILSKCLNLQRVTSIFNQHKIKEIIYPVFVESDPSPWTPPSFSKKKYNPYSDASFLQIAIFSGVTSCPQEPPSPKKSFLLTISLWFDNFKSWIQTFKSEASLLWADSKSSAAGFCWDNVSRPKADSLAISKFEFIEKWVGPGPTQSEESRNFCSWKKCFLLKSIFFLVLSIMGVKVFLMENIDISLHLTTKSR